MNQLQSIFNGIEEKYLNSEVYSRNLLFNITKDEFIIEFTEDDEYYDLGFYKVEVFVDYQYYEAVSSFFDTFLTNPVNKKVKFFYKLFIDIGLLNYFVENTILYDDNKEWCIINNRLCLDKKDILINKNIKFMIDLSNYNNKFIYQFKKIDYHLKIDKKYLLSLYDLNLKNIKLDMNGILSYTNSASKTLSIAAEDLSELDIVTLDKYVQFLFNNQLDKSYEILYECQFVIKSGECKSYNEWKLMFNQKYLEKFRIFNSPLFIKSCKLMIQLDIEFTFEMNRKEYKTFLKEFQKLLKCFDSYNLSCMYVDVESNIGYEYYAYEDKCLEKLD